MVVNEEMHFSQIHHVAQMTVQLFFYASPQRYQEPYYSKWTFPKYTVNILTVCLFQLLLPPLRIEQTVKNLTEHLGKV